MRQDVEQIINKTKIDETKLQEAMRIIDRAARIMEECCYDTDTKAKEKLIALQTLQNELRELTGKENYDIMFFKKPEMLKNKHFRLFLFLVCF